MPDTPALPLPHAKAPADTPAALPLDLQPEALQVRLPADADTLPAAAATPAAVAAGVGEGAEVSAGAEAAEPTEAAVPAEATEVAPKAALGKAARDLSPAACAELLKQHFPMLFGGQPKPLKLRIQADIAQRAPGVFSKASMSAFFRRYTGSTAYLIALGKASQRFDLDGQPAGELSEEHRQLARDELTRRRQVTREREQQVQVQQQAQQQAQQAQQQAQQAEVLKARQARLALLRDFERTTLTPANFCALKGLTPEALEPLLAQARQEAAEAPPPRAWQPDERRGPRADDRDGRGGPRPDHRPAGGGSRLDNRGDRQPDVRTDARTDTRPGARTDSRPNTGSGARPDGRPDARPGGRQDNSPNSRPNDRPNDKPISRPNSRPNSRPGGRPPGRPTER